MLFKRQVARKPDLYPWAQDYIDAMWAGHWTPNEFNFQADLQQFKTELTDQERDLIVRTLSAIGQIEIAVKTFWARLGDNLPHPSISDLGYTMANIEVIHNKAYEKLIQVLGLEHVFEENLKLDVVSGRVNYLRKYLEKNFEDEKRQYIYSIILFTLFVENVSLFSQFYIVLWFNRFKKVLKDTSQQVQYTKNEELIHGMAGSKIINQLRLEYPQYFDDEMDAKVKRAVKQALKAETEVVEWLLGDYEGPSLSKNILIEFVKDRINESTEGIGFGKHLEVDEKILEEAMWMKEMIYANAMTDFFHKKPTEYGKKTQSFSAKDLFD